MRFLLIFLVFFAFFSVFNIVLAIEPPTVNGFNVSDIWDKLSNFLNKFAEILEKTGEPFKEIIKALGNFFIWVLELLIKVIRWALSYLG